MIISLASFRKALRPQRRQRPQWSGVILYEGPSLLDGKPIVVVANRIAESSGNTKTGAMVQTFIIRQDVAPHVAQRTGDDESICGQCPQRPSLGGKCYVKVFQSVLSVYDAYKRGRYARPGVDYDPALLPALFEGLAFRIGSYGDPAAAPFQVWRAATLRAKKITGYTHQWRDARFAAFRLLTMASADSEQDMSEAVANGWRTFRAKPIGAPSLVNELVCPASEEAGKRTNCASCGLCNGMSNKAHAPRNIVIELHGPRAPRRKLAA